MQITSHSAQLYLRVAYYLLPIACCLFLVLSTDDCRSDEPEFIDCSLLVAPDYPSTWPQSPFPRFKFMPERTIGPDSPYNVDVLLIDGNTGTQLDVPPHSVADWRSQTRPKRGSSAAKRASSISVICSTKHPRARVRW